MGADLKQIFIGVASQRFSFIVNSYFFKGPYVEHDPKTGFVTVCYLATNVAIECIFDQREEDIDCKVALVRNGKLAEGYSVDSNGKLVRQGLAQLLRDRGVRKKLFTNVSGLPLEDRIKVILEDFAKMLREHGTDILSDSGDIFA